jgi:nitroimidazol reductase NimA-like FMN-containing flavoprotein (pyridoxamine 5'-phosphate oxidase superfamily)
MSDSATGNAHGGPAQPGPGDNPATGRPVPEKLDEAECLRLVSSTELGRLAYTGRYGLTVLPVNYKLHDGDIVFRTTHDGPVDEDLRTGITGAEYLVAFEVDEVDRAAREGWSVLIHGAAHHVHSASEHAELLEAGVESWAGGDKEHFIRIITTQVTGRRIHPAG